MSALVNAILPFVEVATGISLFLGISSLLVGYLLSAFTGRSNDRGRFL